MKSLRSGVVLVATLLLLVALGLLAAGLIWAAEQSRLTASARLDITRARIASETAAAEALSAWSTSRLADLPLGAVRQIPPDSSPEAAVTAQHLAGDFYLVIAHGFAPYGGHARSATGALVMTLSVRQLWLPFGAALQAGTDVRVQDAHVTGIDRTAAAPPGWPEPICAGARDSLKAMFGDSVRPGITMKPGSSPQQSGGSIEGMPQVTTDIALADSASFSMLGPLSPANLARIADRLEHGPVHPSPAVNGQTCNPAAPANWGDPQNPKSPCADYFPLIYAQGDLTITGGAGQGVLVVAGNLKLEESAAFYGPILVAGDLDVEAGSAMYGAVRARGKTHDVKIDHATIAYSSCTLYRALRTAPALNRAFRPGTRWFIPLF